MRRFAPLFACFVLSAWLGMRAARGAPSVLAQPGAAVPAAASSAARGSSVVYPPASAGLRMDHRSAGHRELACGECHVRAASAPGAIAARGKAPEPPSWPALRAKEASCARCHADRTDRARSSAETCGYCHVGYDPARSTAVPASGAARPRLVFSHDRHRDVACARCHAPPEPGAALASPALPSMQSCFACHSGTRELACAACHPSQPSGRLRSTFPEGQLIPRGALLGMQHDADFVVRHRWLAADHGETCASCHTEDECARCHDGAHKPRGIHPNDYLALHPQDARRAATRCNSCHSSQSFCTACHARLGIAQLSAPDLATPRRFHPPAAQWARGPTLHAREAQRALDTCITCHSERDCIACHGSRGAGFGGSSPHPAGFMRECSRAFARDPRPCLACHRSGDAALARCQR